MSRLSLDQQLELVKAEWKKILPKREVKFIKTVFGISIKEESLVDYYNRVKLILNKYEVKPKPTK